MKKTASLSVLHIIPDLGAGGAEKMLAQLVSRQAPTDIRHVVVSLLRGGTYGPSLTQARVELLELDFSHLTGIAVGIFKILRIVMELKPTLIQGWMYYGDALAVLAAAITGRRKRT